MRRKLYEIIKDEFVAEAEDVVVEETNYLVVGACVSGSELIEEAVMDLLLITGRSAYANLRE